jgi:hypothetical protein
MPFDEAQAAQMDEAARKALEELRANIDGWTARDLITWWAGWYLKAGHKRLGRILVGISKNADS